MTTWATYVMRVAKTTVTTEIAKKTGINQSSVYRWLHEEASPSTAHAAKFAQSYGRNVLEAFVAAEFLTREEAKMPAGGIDLSTVSPAELAQEVTRRLVGTEDELGARRRRRETPDVPPVPSGVAAYDEDYPSGYDVQVAAQDEAAEADETDVTDRDEEG